MLMYLAPDIHSPATCTTSSYDETYWRSDVTWQKTRLSPSLALHSRQSMTITTLTHTAGPTSSLITTSHSVSCGMWAQPTCEKMCPPCTGSIAVWVRRQQSGSTWRSFRMWRSMAFISTKCSGWVEVSIRSPMTIRAIQGPLHFID